VKELLDYAKANPGKLSYGSPGAGSMSYLAGELFKSLTSLHDVLHVPYRGMGPAIADAIAGQVAMITPNVTGQIIELHNSGKLRLLAVTSPERLGAAPQIPTAIEGGIPRMVAQNFIGLFAPARTPKPVVEQIAQATRAAMADQNLQKMYLASGFAPAIDSNAEKAQQLINEEIVRWTPIIKSIGLNLD
jgi:tripartite-type tricarboxylate transporter receptor subunit TctC